MIFLYRTYERRSVFPSCVRIFHLLFILISLIRTVVIHNSLMSNLISVIISFNDLATGRLFMVDGVILIAIVNARKFDAFALTNDDAFVRLICDFNIIEANNGSWRLESR